MQRKQSGLSMVGFVLVAALVAVVVILGMKSVPAVIEYYTILKNVKAIAKSSELRGGTVAGEHSVILAGENERIVLSHVAEDRALFARGALTGATWLMGRDPGRYSMEHVLGL